MRARVRNLIRQHNWEVVEVPRANLYKHFENVQEWGNMEHYKAIRSWCAGTFPKGSWEASFGATKKFVFREPKHATFFKMKWS